ncbi:hypothetical protein GCM10027269_23570 [Kribbella endophytica]
MVDVGHDGHVAQVITEGHAEALQAVGLANQRQAVVTESQAVATAGVVSLVEPLDLLIDALRSHLILPVTPRAGETGRRRGR